MGVPVPIYTSLDGGFFQQSPEIYHQNFESRRSEKLATTAMDSSKRGNGGQLPRGNKEWNHQRSFNKRNSNMRRQRGGFDRGFVGPSFRTFNPFMFPQMPVPIFPFGNNFMYPDLATTPMFYAQGPIWFPMQPLGYFPIQYPELPEKIMTQIDYYFSEKNLVTDAHLRGCMDEQGWVHVNLIATFPKVLDMFNNVPNVKLILDTMRRSKAVEVRGKKIRKRYDWKRWIIPKSINVETIYSSSKSKSNQVATNRIEGCK